MKKRASEYRVTKFVLFTLDILLAFSIIFFARNIISQPFGKLALIFGFVMMFITTVLRLIRQW